MHGDRERTAQKADDNQNSDLSYLSRPLPTLIVMYHPDLERVGDRVVANELMSGRPLQLSRQEPVFSPLQNRVPRPLDDPFISRTPITLVQSVGGLTIQRGAARTALTVNGQKVQNERFIGEDRLQQGVVLTLGRRVVLWLQWRPRPAAQPNARYGLIGESAALLHAITRLETAAASDQCVLLCGPSGSGKERFARAIHNASGRQRNPYLAVNVAELAPEQAAGDLFFDVTTDTTTDTLTQLGYFQRAAGGTLLLKNIDEAPLTVQSSLVRTLEQWDVRPVGGTVAEKIQTRLIATTSVDLETTVRDGRFRRSLRQRLTEFVIQVPSLVEHMEDLGLLFKHFLEQEAASIGCQQRLQQTNPHAEPWVPAPLVAALFQYDWPGNVDQLRLCTRQLVAAGRDLDQIPMVEWEQFQADASAWDADVPRQPIVDRGHRAQCDISAEDLHRVMMAEGFETSAVAARLNIPLSALYALIRRTDGLHLIEDLEPATIIDAYQRTHGDIDAMVRALKVSRTALTERMGDLDLSNPATDDTRDPT